MQRYVARCANEEALGLPYTYYGCAYYGHTDEEALAHVGRAHHVDVPAVALLHDRLGLGVGQELTYILRPLLDVVSSKL